MELSFPLTAVGWRSDREGRFGRPYGPWAVRYAVVDTGLRLSSRLRTFAIEWFDANGPREGHRLGREADPIVARLVFQSSVNRQAHDVLQRGRALPRRIKRDVLDDPE